jgi:hypothetical protein
MILAALRAKPPGSQETIVVCAPSNAAVANAALKYFERNRSLFDIVVYGENCEKSVTFLNPVHRGRYFSEKIEEFQKRCELNPDKIEALERDFISSLVAWLHLSDALDWTISDLAHICPFIDTQSREGRDALSELLAESPVLFCSLNSLGSNQLRINLQVSTIFFDEAAQSPEAEFYIAATFPGVKRMIVMGDPMQLPATVLDPQCRMAGYGSSWLEHVLRLHGDEVHLLDTQYRMDPDILAFPNEEFYGSRIISGRNVFGRTPEVETPFLFINTNGKGSEEQNGISWMNIYEANLIKSLLFDDKDIIRLLRDSEGIVRVIVITPYRAQAQLLEQTLTKSLTTKYTNLRIEVATVDSFQGQEAEIVIFSPVRTHSVGFVDEQQRINVALTRAKRLLRVVGDANFFETLGATSVLKRLVRHAKATKRCKESNLKPLAWCRPNWDQTTTWKPVWTSRFQNCIQKMGAKQRNIALNTLFAIANCEEKQICPPVSRRKQPGWYISALKEHHREVKVVWIGKQGAPRPVVEAVFAGSDAECRNFTQKHSQPPTDACIVMPGLKGIADAGLIAEESEDNLEDVWVAWAVTNMNQQIVLEGGELPSGSLKLDIEQERVARSPYPLMIESRSGTGKV